MSTPRHPKGTQARVLLTSVFGPYARDDEYGSRAINPMELYHNQVTREQGAFSLRMFHRSWGIMMIQANIKAPSTLLDFPSLDRFVEEIREREYDVVGISSIMANIQKLEKMCALVREHQPRATIVVGGHVANVPGIEERIDADYVVKGEGISWFRQFLGQDRNDPIEHPEIVSGIGARTMGISLASKRGDVAAVLIPSVGCPMGCNFCSTSAMFGGKGKHVDFYKTGSQLFDIMERFERNMRVQSFFVMDENFLMHRKRALQLLELMREHRKSWSLYIFSSAKVLGSYSMEELLGLGISWVWMGLEGEDSPYTKLRDTDTLQLVRTLQSNGIKVLGSTIIGLETHTPENIAGAIDYAVAHDTDFHQFMLYTPVPGTPLYAEHAANGTLDPEVSEADSHGQQHFNFFHPHISRHQSGEFLRNAFRLDFRTNGPSVMRIARTALQGWKKHKNHPDARIRERFRRDATSLSFSFAGALWAMERYFRDTNEPLARKIRHLRQEINDEFGLKARLSGPVGGAIVRRLLHREERRLERGVALEPPTFVEKRNWHTAAQEAN